MLKSGYCFSVLKFVYIYKYFLYKYTCIHTHIDTLHKYIQIYTCIYVYIPCVYIYIYHMYAYIHHTVPIVNMGGFKLAKKYLVSSPKRVQPSLHHSGRGKPLSLM